MTDITDCLIINGVHHSEHDVLCAISKRYIMNYIGPLDILYVFRTNHNVTYTVLYDKMTKLDYEMFLREFIDDFTYEDADNYLNNYMSMPVRKRHNINNMIYSWLMENGFILNHESPQMQNEAEPEEPEDIDDDNGEGDVDVEGDF